MQGKQLSEYAVIRVVPRVEREEFLNVGVVLYCRKANFLQCIFKLDDSRLKNFYSELDIGQVQEYLEAFQLIATGDAAGGPIARLDTASRFRWLTATRSTILQTSKVHPAFCDDPQKSLQKLFEEFVL